MKLAAAVWTPFSGAQGQTYARPVDKVCFHRTQGSTAQGAFGVYAQNKVEPHFTADASPEVNKIWQHVDTDRAAWSLRSHDQDGVIQVEIVGFSERAHEWGQTEYRNLSDMLRPVFAHHKIPAVSTVARPWPATGDEGYGKHRTSRLGVAEFHSYEGVLGHVHVPDNSHWDPGNFDVATFLEELNPTPGPDLPNEDDMPELFGRHKTGNTMYGIWANGTVRALGPAEFKYYRRRNPKAVVIVTNADSEVKRWKRASP